MLVFVQRADLPDWTPVGVHEPAPRTAVPDTAARHADRASRDSSSDDGLVTRAEPGFELGQRTSLASGDTLPSVAAYRAGVELLRRRTGVSIQAAAVQFEEAIRHDPDF